MNRFLGRALWATAAAAATAATAFGQVVADAVPLMSQQHILNAPQSGWQPAGPGDFHDVPNVNRFSTFTTDPSQSVLNQVREVPADGWANPYPGPHFGGDKLQSDGVADGGGDSRFIDQPLDCTTGWFSNNNSNGNPFLRFEDFRAGADPLRNVKFYGGVYLGNINDIARIGVEIWTIQGVGDECGWTYQSFVGSQTFTLAEVNPVYNCTGDFFDTYEMQANFSSPIALNPGQVYMILIYATLNDPNAPGLFTWNQSTASNYNPARSWDRTTQTYLGGCGPDMAFTTNVGSDCFENDCQTTCYFSNYFSNQNPYIVADDFTATATADVRQLQFTGGVYDAGSGGGALLGNIAGFLIEIYTIVPDNGQTCDSSLTGFLGAYQVSMADARPVFDCVDLFGIPQYQFTVAIPASVYSLLAGTDYALGVYAIPVDPDSLELFCWGGTDQVYGLTSWSYNQDTGMRDEPCHDVDQAFCINGDRPCLGDFNKDGTRNTLDVLAFLNAWNARHPSADINGDGVINTLDVLAFLNRWNVPC